MNHHPLWRRIVLPQVVRVVLPSCFQYAAADDQGYETVRHFAKLGARVVMINHKDDDSAGAIKRVKAQPGQSSVNIEAVSCDIGLLKDVQRVCQEQAKKLDRLDLVSCLFSLQ